MPGLLSPSDEQKLRDLFAELSRTVHIVFFTQTFDCETCLQTRQIIDELAALSDRILVDEVNFVLDKDKAQQYGVDRVPALALAYDGAPGESGAVLQDTRIRFLGAPTGYEFMSLVQAVLLAGGRSPRLSEGSKARLARIEQPISMQVFTTPT
jgi:alkyl hydroperoxide reductase subunit AhpF